MILDKGGVEIVFKIIYSHAKVIHKMYRYTNDLLIISSLYLVMKFLAAEGEFKGKQTTGKTGVQEPSGFTV